MPNPEEGIEQRSLMEKQNKNPQNPKQEGESGISIAGFKSKNALDFHLRICRTWFECS